MKKKFSVKWTSLAENDLEKIIDYIFSESPANAIDSFERIKTAAEELYCFPERGRIIPELEAQGVFLFRELVVNPWRIMYRISHQIVYVLAVFDSRQNLENIILKRIIGN
jgi:plasmid stabilization system protein ParE